jgi:Domain of unknown function (DUF4062)
MARIYLSSTYEDLRPFRDAVTQTLRRMQHEVVAMEAMTASDRRPVAECLADVERCALYIGVLARRRGFVPEEGNGRAITELEYEHARGKMERLMFLLSPSVAWPSEFIDPPEDGPGTISAFRKRVQEAHVTAYFENPDQLATAVAVAVRMWEIETGQSPPPAPLVLPEEVRVLEYIPYDRVKMRFRLHPLATVLHTLFGTFWIGTVLAVLVSTLTEPSFDGGSAGCNVIFLLFFLAMGLFFFVRRRTITFDMKNHWVKTSMPGAFSRGRPVVHGLEFIVSATKRGWRSSIRYGICELARTEYLPDAESARAHLRPFAVALNQQLGISILNEKEERS